MTAVLTSVLSPVRPDAVDGTDSAEIWALDYERPPKAVEGDFALLALGDGVAVITSSAFRLLEARRTDRGMRGPFATADEALAAVVE